MVKPKIPFLIQHLWTNWIWKSFQFRWSQRKGHMVLEKANARHMKHQMTYKIYYRKRTINHKDWRNSSNSSQNLLASITLALLLSKSRCFIKKEGFLNNRWVKKSYTKVLVSNAHWVNLSCKIVNWITILSSSMA